MRHSAAILTAALATAATAVLASPTAVVARPAPSPDDTSSPALHKQGHPGTPASQGRLSGPGEVVPGRYVVVLRAGHQDRLRGLAARTDARSGAEVSRVYRHGLHGFAARLSPQAARRLAADPAVAYVEPDRVYRAAGTEVDPPWGLDRIDQRGRSLNHRYAYDVMGAGVTAYVIDSGIRRSHKDFTGRVGTGFTAVKDGRGARDCNGHGTHVAGTIGGKRYGVAKAVTLVPVRVLGCKGGGTLSGIIAGIDWVTSHHKGTAPAVANMSLGGGWSKAMNAAVRRSVLDGVTYVVAAGNESDDACKLSPAAVGSAITVGATNAGDSRPAFSDYGWCLDVFAPGVGIRSAGIKSDTASVVLDGTSMASPHVAGAAALYLQAHPAATPAQVGDALDAAATTGVVGNKRAGSPNRLLYSFIDRVAPAPVLPPTDNVVTNPSFERGATGWTATAGVVTDDAHSRARTGAWVAWLSGWGETHTDTLSQVVTVPATAAPRLSFWRKIATEEPADDAYDTMTVSVESNGVETELAMVSNLQESDGWVPVELDLTPYAGQTVTVRLTGVEDSTGFTSFLVDDLYVTGE